MTRRPTIADLPERYQRQAEAYLQPAAKSVPAEKNKSDKSAAVPTGREAAFQTAVEQHLELNGYWPRSDKALAAGVPPRGWYLHLAQCRQNPILLDLLVLDHSGAWWELELKTGTGRLRINQKRILEQSDRAALVRSLPEYRAWAAARLIHAEDQPERTPDHA